MGLKRNAPSSDDEDHDADFQLSDRAASSAVSRLKRPKRRTSRHPSSTPPSSHLANDHEGEESDEVIFVPDSLEQDDDVTVQNHKPADHSTNPQHPQNTSSPASNQKQNADHDNSDPPIISETPPDAITTSPPQRSPRETAHPSKAATDTSPESGQRPKRVRKLAVRATFLSDSDNDPSTNNFNDDDNDDDDDDDANGDDDEAYNSQDDSPDEDDLDDEFEPSPKRASRAATKVKAPKRAAATSNSTAPRKSTTKRPAVKPKAIGKATKSTKVTSEKKPSAKTSSAQASLSKRQLGARLPMKTGIVGRATNGETKERSSARVGAGGVYRSGLSRNAAVPRLHSYLDKKS